ncbi:ABC transporter permease [Sneathiella glossodoripedis]|uniref:ABC transporter permease n=1 Tax=Sneathiella glossodoripedis TaxID=418853 RepID=UPI0004717EBB|nr:ABC transporter permease [Sneathiella glossodoripedis]
MSSIGLLHSPGRSGLSLVALGLPVLLFVIISLISPSFLSVQNLSNVNAQITALLIIALGQMIVAISGGIDLSVGSVLSLTSTLLVSVDPTLSIPTVLLVGVCVGLVNGVGVAIFTVHPLVMTLASMTFLQGLALLILPVPGGSIPGFLEALVDFSFLGLPAAFYWCLTFVLLAAFLLRATKFGMRLFAVGANAQNAARNGVNVTFYKILSYVLCSTSAVMAGMYLSARVASADATMGASFALESVTAVALGGVQLAGGVGSVPGVIAGTITLGLMTNGMNLIGVSPFVRASATGVLLLIAISLQPRKAIGA